MIIDTDMALDDWPAILYLARDPGVELVGISVTGAGEAHVEPGTRHALGLLKLAGLEDERVPVFGGTALPLEGQNPFPAPWRQNADDLFGLELPPTDQEPSPEPAAAALCRILKSSSEKVTLTTLGPLTNIAAALEKDPSIAEKIERVTIMGGAVRVPGNLVVPGFTDDLTNRAAEWNIYADPKAADIVFRSGVPITLVPLDATNKVQVTMEFLEALEEHHPNPVATFLRDEFEKNRAFIESGEFYFWDPMAAAVAADRAGEICTVESIPLTVETRPGDEAGRTREDRKNGTMVDVCTRANAEVFLDRFFERVSGVPNMYARIQELKAARTAAPGSPQPADRS